MAPPKNARLIEMRTSTIWIDEDDILHSISKKVPPQTLEETKQALEEFKKIFGEKKFCMLADVTNAAPISKEVRQYAAEELAKMVKAIAMISNSALGKMVVNLFFNLKPPPYPTKMFNNEKDAKEWLKKYL